MKSLRFRGRKRHRRPAWGDFPEGAMLHALTYRGGLLRADPVQGMQLQHVFADIHSLGLQTVLCKKSHRLPDAALHIRRGGNQRVLSDLYVGLVLRLLRRILHDLGHEEGDRVLRETASIIAEAFGKEYSYRYGGDEFLVVYPDASEADFEKKLDAMMKRRPSIVIDGVKSEIGISAGMIHEKLDDPHKLRNLFSAADERMYQMKRSHGLEQSPAH